MSAHTGISSRAYPSGLPTFRDSIRASSSAFASTISASFNRISARSPGVESSQQQNGVYGVYLLIDGRPRFKTVGVKLSEARRQRNLLLAQADRRELVAPSRLSFADLASGWLEGFEGLVHAGERSERTLEHYRYMLKNHLLPALGRKRVQEITTDDIAQLIATLRRKNLSGKTISSTLVPLNRILNHAVRRGHISSNPVLRLEKHERPRPGHREQRVLNHHEIERLFSHCLPRYKPFLITALYTGMRLSELLGLTWQDIDFDRQVIYVRYQLSRGTRHKPPRRIKLKTRAATRDIPLLPQLAAMLRRHKLAQHHSSPTDYVFATATGTALQFRNLERRGLGHAADTALQFRNLERRGLGHAADTANLNPPHLARLRVHDLRHTFASHLIIDLKLDVAQVSRILGHSRPSVTLDTYTHLFNHANHAEDIRQRMAQSSFGNLLG